jgi:hypothetical protein
MEERELNQILAGKQRRRQELARLPIEQKLLAVVRLQELAAPILRQRGKTVRCWSAEYSDPRGNEGMRVLTVKA